MEAGPNACPFVALEHDRDARSQLPDARHRCYAEQVPAPRTLDYQEKFCLSPNFAACPVFAEWAVRAAARPIPGTGAAAVGVAADPAPELWHERLDKTTQPKGEERWPDSMEGGVPVAAAALAAENATQAEGQQLAAFDASATPPAEPIEIEEPVGLAEPVVPEAVVDEPPLGASAMLAAPDAVDEDRGFDPAPLPTFLTARSPRPRFDAPAASTDENLAPVADPSVRRSSGRRDNDGESGFTRLLTMAAVVIILALGIATVLIVPGLLAGNPGTTARPTLVAGSSRQPTAVGTNGGVGATGSPANGTVAPATPTPVPEATPTPTPRSYKIQPGDRLRQIAREFGVTVEQIMAANPEIADPNDIQVGQRILIPSP